MLIVELWRTFFGTCSPAIERGSISLTHWVVSSICAFDIRSNSNQFRVPRRCRLVTGGSGLMAREQAQRLRQERRRQDFSVLACWFLPA